MPTAPHSARPSSEDIAALYASGTFDEAWYVAEYPDVAMSGMEPAFHYLWLGRRLGRQPSNITAPPAVAPPPSYEEWIAQHDTITPTDIDAMKAAAWTWANKPKFSVIMPVYNTPEQLLRAALDSVIAQAYPHWELCIADDCSPSPDVRRVLDEYAAQDSRIKVIYREKNGHISEASNSAISIATGEWYALMDHDDVLPPHALYCMSHAIVHNPDVKLLYSDEDKINQAGQREGAYFKSDFNLELFRSHNMISHFGVYHRSLIDKVGGFRSEFNGSQDYDLALRCIEVLRPEQIQHIPRVLYHWRMIEGSTALSNEEKPYAMLAGERAINEHYRRCGINATAELFNYGYRTRYHLENKPLVSIVIPTRNAGDLVRRCIDSLVVKTTYENYEILIVDNGSDAAKDVDYFCALSANSRITVIRDDRPFNYSALNNRGVGACLGDILVFLNNDTEVISHDWLETMVGHAIQPGVGAVGVKLLFPDDTIQHSGVILGLGGIAGHGHLGLNRHDAGFFGRLGLANEYSAVTAACLAVSRDHFRAVGGFNEVDVPIAFSDVDLCLRLRKHGLRNIYTPFAELYHHESSTRGSDLATLEKRDAFEQARAYMNKTWGDMIALDPAYSPNLTLDFPNFGLAAKPRVPKIW